MLREIQSSHGKCSPTLVLHQIALVQLESELADYISQVLLKRWPKARVLRLDQDGALKVDLRICSALPIQQDGVPTLWLWQLESHTSTAQLAPWLWRAPMPISARHLMRAIACVFR